MNNQNSHGSKNQGKTVESKKDVMDKSGVKPQGFQGKSGTSQQGTQGKSGFKPQDGSR